MFTPNVGLRVFFLIKKNQSFIDIYTNAKVYS
jgi:hypothetical protein